jgi:hypothetical protein
LASKIWPAKGFPTTIVSVDPTQLTIGHLSTLRQDFLSRRDVFSTSRQELAIDFLKTILALPKETPPEDVASTYRPFDSDAPADSGPSFWSFIARQYLQLAKEPRAEYLKLVEQATGDLASIAEQLRYIASEIAALEETKREHGRLPPEQRYYRNQLEYFKGKNEAARVRIVEFLTHSLRHGALRAAESSIWRNFTRVLDRLLPRSPYGYVQRSGFRGDFFGPFDVRSVHDLSNKFLDVDVSTHLEIRKLYDMDRTQFYQVAAEYIAGKPGVRPSIAQKICAHVVRSHLLDRRKQLIATMLAHFAAKDYLSFVSMAPLQVEGIFGDVCKELGIPESRLDISSLNEKLELIEDKLSGFRYLEYYAFKFPVLRNTVAHGELVDGDLEHTATLLLLDLLPVCELACAKELPTMRTLAALEALIEGPKPQKLLDWIELRQTPISAFYDRAQQIAQVDRLYEGDAFWSFVRERLQDAEGRPKLRELIGRLKAAGLAHDRCVDFFKNHNRWIAEEDRRLASALPQLKTPDRPDSNLGQSTG